MSLFLDQVIRTLASEQNDAATKSGHSRDSAGARTLTSEISIAATKHGRELLVHGFSLDEVVHDYGDLCQAVTELAVERDAPVSADDFRVLNRCLDNAIADAVTEFSYHRDANTAERTAKDLNIRLGTLAHELRNHIHTATLALSSIRSGAVALNGATGAVLERSLTGLRNLIDRSLADLRVETGIPAAHRELFSLSEFIRQIDASASLDAERRECVFSVEAVDPTLAIEGDRDLLFSALGNLLENAFKFTVKRSSVTLQAYAKADRILIEVEDACGGIPEGDTEAIFRPFVQNSEDRSGMGLGLSICRRSVGANGGVLRVRDIPGHGCVFTIDLAKHSLEPAPFP